MNSITEKIFYISDNNQNQRFVISAMTKNPRTWQVSKCEDMLMGEFGLMRLTFVQVAFNKSVDFVDHDALNPDGSKDVYAMYADYFESSVSPTEVPNVDLVSERCVVSASTNTIKSGGSYKNVTATFYDNTGTDITDVYLPQLSMDNWHFYIDNTEILPGELITVLEQPVTNKIKIRFTKNDNYLTKVLVVKCISGDIVGELSFEITNL